jgi:PhnB protein
MCGDTPPDMDPMPAALAVYVDDGPAVDATFARALDAGATEEEAPVDKFYGYRSATVRDVAGNRWTISAVIEKLTAEEIQKRMAAL